MNLCRASLAGEERLSLTAAAATRGRDGLMLGTTLVSTNTSFTPLTAAPHRGAEIRAGGGGGPRLTPRDSSTPGTGGEGGKGAWSCSPMEISSPRHISPLETFPCRRLSLWMYIAWTATCCGNRTKTTFVADSLAQSYHMYNLDHIIIGHKGHCAEPGASPTRSSTAASCRGHCNHCPKQL